MELLLYSERNDANTFSMSCTSSSVGVLPLVDDSFSAPLKTSSDPSFGRWGAAIAVVSRTGDLRRSVALI